MYSIYKCVITSSASQVPAAVIPERQTDKQGRWFQKKDWVCTRTVLPLISVNPRCLVEGRMHRSCPPMSEEGLQGRILKSLSAQSFD